MEKDLEEIFEDLEKKGFKRITLPSTPEDLKRERNFYEQLKKIYDEISEWRRRSRSSNYVIGK